MVKEKKITIYPYRVNWGNVGILLFFVYCFCILITEPAKYTTLVSISAFQLIVFLLLTIYGLVKVADPFNKFVLQAIVKKQGD